MRHNNFIYLTDTTSSDIDDEPPPPGMETSIDDNTLAKDTSVSAQAQPETGQTESGNDSKTNTTKEVNFINEPGF